MNVGQLERKIIDELEEELPVLMSRYLEVKRVQTGLLWELNQGKAKLRTGVSKWVPHFEGVCPIKGNTLKSVVRTNEYVTLKSNITTDNLNQLRIIPFDYTLNSGVLLKELEDQGVNSKLAEENCASGFLENTQFFAMIYQSLECSIERVGGMNFARGLSRLLDKEPSAVLSEMNQLRARNCYSECPRSKINEIVRNYCVYCSQYYCLVHYYRNESKAYESGTDYKNVPSNVESIRKYDPENWKTKLFALEHHMLCTGQWAAAYQCPHHCPEDSLERLDLIEKDILRQLVKSGTSNPCFIALFLTVPCASARKYLMKHSLSATCSPAPALLTRYFTPRTPLVIGTVFLSKCACKVECTVTLCPCIRGEQSDASADHIKLKKTCDRFCACSTTCSNRFLGCDCLYGNCAEQSCICLLSNRECDPQYCRLCCAYASIHSQGSSQNLCENVASQKYRRIRTALATSGIPGAGLGMFLLRTVPKGRFLTEYTGEFIKDRETFIRSSVYDRNEHSYIFSLGLEKDWTNDAKFYGSKARYINHKSHDEENCYTKDFIVNGIYKILVFASRKIAKFEELYINYGYDLKTVNYAWYQDYEAKFLKRRKK